MRVLRDPAPGKAWLDDARQMCGDHHLCNVFLIVTLSPHSALMPDINVIDQPPRPDHQLVPDGLKTPGAAASQSGRQSGSQPDNCRVHSEKAATVITCHLSKLYLF